MTITKRPVTLTVEETEWLLSLLRDSSRSDWDHARRTKSAAIREFCETRGRMASDLAETCVRRLYVSATDESDARDLAEMSEA